MVSKDRLKELKGDEDPLDKLEKEAFYTLESVTAASLGTDDADEEAGGVCDVCMDGECEDTNEIVFCDGCNTPVHQACYGILNIPEGKYLCATCSEGAPLDSVPCVLCPNTGGAYKPTAQGEWAHVACAMWIPETSFADTLAMEPIVGLDDVPEARYKLRCYLCKTRRAGACIQCRTPSCAIAFHVTCAQKHGLFMRVQEDRWHRIVYAVYCEKHTPSDATVNKYRLAASRKPTKLKVAKSFKETLEASITLPRAAARLPNLPAGLVRDVLGVNLDLDENVKRFDFGLVDGH